MSSVPSWLTDAAAINPGSNSSTPVNGHRPGPPVNHPAMPNGAGYNPHNSNINSGNPEMDASAMFDPSLGFMPQQNNMYNVPSGFQQPGQQPTPQPQQQMYNMPPQQQAQQHRMSNGTVQNPSYQVPSVVPTKRPRPREDSIGASPHQAPGALSGSHSGTPQPMQFQGYPNSHQYAGAPPHPPQQQQQQQQQPPGAPQPQFPHLQQDNSSTATPSPVMPNQQFQAQNMAQRMSTASPSPFSPRPTTQGFGPQGSPPPSDHSSRVNTPHGPRPHPQQHPQHPGTFTPGAGGSTPGGTGYPNPYQQQQPFNLPPGMPQHGPSNAMAAPNLSIQAQQQQKIYQMQLQQQQQQHQQQQGQQYPPHMMGGNRAPNGAMTPMGHPGQQAMQQGQPGMRAPPSQPPQQQPPQQQQQQTPQGPGQMQRPMNPEQFLRGLAQFMQSRNLAFNANPTIGDRAISLMQLYMTVLRLGGSKRVSQTNSWQVVAHNIHLAPVQYPRAPQQLKEIFERNLAAYEETWINQSQQAQERQRAAMAQSSQQPQGNQPQQSPQQAQPFPQALQQSPTPHAHQAHHPPSQPPSTPVHQQMIPKQENMRQSSVNGFTPPPPVPPQQQPPNRQNLPHSQSPGMPDGQHLSQSPMMAPKQERERPLPHEQPGTTNLTGAVATKAAQTSDNYEPAVRDLDTYGGIDVGVLGQIGAELSFHKPVVPMFMELGVIDVHAITLSLQSGIGPEVRLALDTLASMSIEPRFQLSLAHCEDLVDILVDCAEVQVDLLAENSPEVSDIMMISPYEDTVRACRLEVETLQEIPAYDTIEYELDRATERLLCITTILRNLSFFDANHDILAETVVIKFLANVIRYLGTRNMLLRTNQNTLDFMKDTITFLSNLAHAIELPGKDEAASFLHYLLAFAPCPSPISLSTEKVMFTAYQPQIHRYLPSAVDTLAKLLARDDPNGGYYKSIFASDSVSSPPYELLTRTFALAISVLPEHVGRNLMPIVEARKPYLVQGMLAAEILASMVPATEHSLARSWLSSEDGFAMSLLRLVCLLSTDRSSAAQRAPPPGYRGPPQQDQEHLYPITITLRGIAVLRRLAEKAQTPTSQHQQQQTKAATEEGTQMEVSTPSDTGSGGIGEVIGGEEQALADLPVNIHLKKESLLGALLHGGIDAAMIKQLCAYSRLEN